VRFLLDPTDPRTVSSMVYIAPTDPWDEGTVVLERLDADDDGAFSNNSGTLTWQQPSEQFPNGSASHVPPYIEDTANPSASADDVWVLRGFDGAESSPPFSSSSPAKSTSWKDLLDRGLIRDGCLLEILDGSSKPPVFAIDTRLLKVADTSDGKPPVRLLLQTKYRTQADTPNTTLIAFNKPIRYRLHLNPAPLQNQEPVQLPKGVVINLDRCSSDPDGRLTTPLRDATNRSVRGGRLPETWKTRPSVPISPFPANPAGFDYSPYCDIMFGPRGSVIGPEAAMGLIHLYVGEQKDADRDRTDWAAAAPGAVANWWSAPEYLPAQTASDPNGTPYQRGDKVIVSLFTRTGAITTNPIHPDDDLAPPANVGKRFEYSETGEVAGK
jgi:hypothetical protein